jgi:hypothetical protein
MTLPDLVAFLATNRLRLTSAQFRATDAVDAFTCEPFPDPPGDVHVHLEHADDGETPEPDALADFIARKRKEPSQ